MSIKCKNCLSDNLVKSGIVLGKQRFKCKDCNSNFRAGDERKKYSNDFKLKVVKWSLEGAGIRSISRMENVSAPLILKWIKSFAKIVKDKLIQVSSDKEKVDVMEIDELVTWIKKNHEETKKQKNLSAENIHSFGLLQIGKSSKLLILK